MSSVGSPVVLCRYGELFLKAGNRTRFAQMLEGNVRKALKGLGSTRVQAPHGRLIVLVDDGELQETCARLERVFGLVSISPGRRIESEPALIMQAAVEAAEAALARRPELRRSFRVEARRSNKRFPLSSLDLAMQAGAAVAQATGVGVSLSDPALVVGIEVGHTATYVFAETRPAPGGLPVGASGKALLLLSGGIDSPAAGWLAAKRGLSLEALYFHSPPFIGEKARDKVLELGRVLAAWQAVDAVHVALFTDVQKRLREAGPAELAVILYRRMMLRVADRVADRIGAAALVTGENLGQVASQTMTNMATIEAASRRLVLRPLLTYDKTETTALARRIGTFDTSALPYDDCCSLFMPAHPSTGARVVDAERAEQSLDVDAEADTVAVERVALT